MAYRQHQRSWRPVTKGMTYRWRSCDHRHDRLMGELCMTACAMARNSSTLGDGYDKVGQLS